MFSCAAKVLSVTGAGAFVRMVNEIMVMELYEEQVHYPDNIPLYQMVGTRFVVGGEGGRLDDIILPTHTPDESTFVMWCNHRAPLPEYSRFYSISITPGSTYGDYDEASGGIFNFEGLAAPSSKQSDTNPTITDLCAAETWFVRMVNQRTVLQVLAPAVCQRNVRAVAGVVVDADYPLSEHVQTLRPRYEDGCQLGTRSTPA